MAEFPLPDSVMPPRLRELLTPVGLVPEERVEVAAMSESDAPGILRERVNMMMAVVPDNGGAPIEVPREEFHGVVEFSVPWLEKCCIENYVPSILGNDYIVASWSDGYFSSFNLAEKVWMSLGLTPRCEGNDRQYIHYDERSEPSESIAEGEISTSYLGKLERDVSWRMRNEYLRRYLWMRGARGFRVFCYEALLDDSPELRKLMKGATHKNIVPKKGVQWYDIDLREHERKLLIQVFAVVEAVSPELCSQPSAENLIWPGMTNQMTRRLADSLVCYTDKNMIYLRDSFLQRYERSNVYKCMPVRSGNSWYCSPSYGNQWGFEYCRRIDRNYIQVPVRELYKGVPDREILYAHDFAVNPAELSGIDQSEEHIMGKVQRFVDVLLRLGNGLAALGKNVGIRVPPEEWVRIERAKIEAEGWAVYPAFRQLSWVVPLDMPQTDFLDRCKVLHEILAERIPVGHLKKLLLRAGCRSESLERWGSIKLLQALLNIMEPLNAQCENISAFVSTEEPNGFSERNERMAMFFLNCDLRNADAHGNHTDWKTRMQERGFDMSGLRVGHGRAFDFVFDGVITSLCTVAAQIETLVATARPARRGSYLQ